MRNGTIDILKLICAIMVIFLHVPGPCYRWYLPLLRCAVPTFLIISGYLLYDANAAKFNARLKKNIRRILWLCFWSTLIYIPIVIVINHGISFLTKRVLFNWAFLNDTPFGFHLWYLFAYLYALIIVLFISRRGFLRLLYISVPVLLSLDLVLGKYSLALLGHEFPYIWVRNFICVGTPYFTIGLLIKKYNHILLKYNKIYTWGGVIFALLSIAEYYLLESNDLNSRRDHYISTTFLSICLFMIALKSGYRNSRLSYLGREYSLYIYIFHVAFFMAMPFVNRQVFGEILAGEINHLFGPIIITAETFLFVFFLKKSQTFINDKYLKQ